MRYYDLFSFLYISDFENKYLYENCKNLYYFNKITNNNLKIFKICINELDKNFLKNLTNINDGNDIFIYNKNIKNLYEYQYIEKYDSEFPDIKLFKKIDYIIIPKLNSKINIGIIEDDRSISVLGEYNNEIIAVLDFEKLSNNKYIIFRKTICKLLRKGITYNLLLWFKRKYDVGIFSDSQMTKEGESFWNYIITNNKDKFKIVDLKYSELYEPEMIGKLSNHNEIILHPRQDNNTNDFINIGSGKQRWAWLFEENKPDINNKFGILLRKYSEQPFFNNYGYEDNF